MAAANERRLDTDLFSSTRKLVRPHLTPAERRRDPSHAADPLSHALVHDHHSHAPSSHAEAFYFQKQIQQQTEMTLVLEDGEELQGVIEWYDRCVLKLRAGRHRILVYKSSLKYLYKSSEAYTPGSVMK